MTYPHSATIQKTTKTGSKYTYGDVGTTACFLQPLDNESAIQYGITFSKGYYCYLPSTTDIDEGDRLIISSETYGVRGLRDHNYGNLPHLRAVLERV